jgi:hypothetical protein
MKNYKLPFLLVLIIIIVIYTGCQKTGVLDVPFENYNYLTVKIEYAAEPKVYTATLDGELITDSLQYSGNFSSVIKTYFGKSTAKHFVLLDKEKAEILIDTILNLKASDVISLIQLQSGQPLFILNKSVGGDEEDPPSNRFVKVRYLYTTPEIVQDSLKLFVFSADYDLWNRYYWDNNGSVASYPYDTLGSVFVYRNQFSEYIQLDVKKAVDTNAYFAYNSPVFFIQLSDPKTGNLIQDPFQEIGPGWGIFKGTSFSLQDECVRGRAFSRFKFMSVLLAQTDWGTGPFYMDMMLYNVPW